MVSFSIIKFACWHDLCYNLPTFVMLFLNFRCHSFSNWFLFIRMIKYSRSVLSANIRALSICSSRILFLQHKNATCYYNILSYMLFYHAFYKRIPLKYHKILSLDWIQPLMLLRGLLFPSKPVFSLNVNKCTIGVCYQRPFYNQDL